MIPQGPPGMTVAGFVVLTAGLAGFHPSKRQPFLGTQELWEGAELLPPAVITILATQDQEGPRTQYP